MEKLTYQAWCTHSAVREDIEKRVRELRHEAVREFIVAPVASFARRIAESLHVKASAPAPKTI